MSKIYLLRNQTIKNQNTFSCFNIKKSNKKFIFDKKKLKLNVILIRNL